MLDRRQLLAGAGGALAGSIMVASGRTAPPTPVPVRIQTPDLAFADALRAVLGRWAASGDAANLELAVVPAEPASNLLLDDARSGLGQFSGAFVPSWLIPDLVRDEFIVPAGPPPIFLPPAIARIRSFGGEWVGTDFDHDCDLLYFRVDLLDQAGLPVAQSWEELDEQAQELNELLGGGVALPQTHAQQAADHFASMAASVVLPESDPTRFWFDPETMDPTIGSEPHIRSLERWRALARTTPEPARSGSTGDLWEALLAGSAGYLIASADFLPYAVARGLSSAIGVSTLPGSTGNDRTIRRAGNVTGSSWGGVVMRSANDRASSEVRGFFEMLAEPETQAELAADPSAGITPLPHGSNRFDEIAAGGWPAKSTSDWLIAIQDTLENPIQLAPLRIAETRRYLQALEERIVPFMASNDGSASDALAAAADDWMEIHRAIGIETQAELYAKSLTAAPGERSQSLGQATGSFYGTPS